MLFVSSSSAINLTFSSLLETWLLSLHTTSIVSQHLHELKWFTSTHIESLDSTCNSWNTGISLTSCATTLDFDLNIEETSIG